MADDELAGMEEVMEEEAELAGAGVMLADGRLLPTEGASTRAGERILMSTPSR